MLFNRLYVSLLTGVALLGTLDSNAQTQPPGIGCRMFRKVAPWYAKRFGPASEFNKRAVLVSTKAEFHDALENYLRWREQFLDESGAL